MTRRRLDPAARRAELVSTGARLFSAKPYDEVLMEDVADEAGVSRALLYRYFPTKSDLFAAVYRQAADSLLSRAHFDPDASIPGQISAALEAHFDYFAANRNTVLAANRTLAGDRGVQAVIDDELAVLRERLLDAGRIPDEVRGAVSAVVLSWLVFVRTLCIEWLTAESFTREQLHDMCVGSLLGALRNIVELE
ncbi:TetR/AcrR family transcriptional regulator [Amycolatopsis endophytica]|uniref:AcrR family transcriptional regulator n=1 Tax=Amycolatopsis endophytica TaxID=860233 RepID=A0A853AYS2_9PSEU|nr:TetR/AcrR family transcriptional regulator [Amycolatopsis endophytica]NYI87711.1 AcrR family transcriptional regulator [Amycolatopsis endophytica]